MKRTVALLLCLILITSLAACAQPTTTPTTAPTAGPTIPPIDIWAKYDPGITLTSAFGIGSANLAKFLEIQPDALTNNVWTRQYESELGIKIEYIWSVPSAQYNDKLNIAISSNDLPDIISCNSVQFKLLVDSGVAADLTKAYADFASPVTRQLQNADSNISINQATIDGKLFALPRFEGNIDQSQLLWIRADWLKTLNLEAPKTIDDLVKVAEAFVKNDPDGNGKDDTVGLGTNKGIFDAGFSGLFGFFQGYHAYPNGWVEDSSGKLAFGGIQPEMKPALSKLADMYKAGLIDKEFIVKDWDKLAEEVAAGKVGMVFGEHWVPYWPLQDSKNNDPKADWQPYALPSVDAKPAKTMLNGSANTFYVVNSSVKTPEAAVKLFNLYSKYYSWIFSPDFDVKFVDGGASTGKNVDQFWEWAPIQNWQPGESLMAWDKVEEYWKTSDAKLLDNSIIKMYVDQITAYKAGDNSLWSTAAWMGPTSPYSVISGYVTNKLTIQNAYVLANTPSMADKGTALDQLRMETFTKIILGTLPPEAFDEYVTSWKGMGGDDITNEVNETAK